VAQRAVAMTHVVAQHAVLPGAQTRDGRARRQVEPAGLETDGRALHALERMRQQQELRLGVEPGPLYARRVPGVADCESRHVAVQLVITRRSDDRTRGIEHGEDQRVAPGLGGERRVDVVLDGLRTRYARVPELPQAALAQGVA